MPAQRWLSAGVALLAGISLGLVLPLASPAARPGVMSSAVHVAGIPVALRPPAGNSKLAAVLAARRPCAQAAAALAFAQLGSVEEIQAVFRERRWFPDNAASGTLLAALFSRWMELDPTGAAEYCRDQQGDLLGQLVAEWSATDAGAAAAAAWLETVPEDSFGSFWNLRFGMAATRDPDKGWTLLANAPDWIKNSGEGLEAFIRRLVRGDVDAAIQRLDTMPPALQPAARRQIVSSLMAQDPAEGWDWLSRERGIPNPLKISARDAGGSAAEEAIRQLDNFPDPDGLTHQAKGAALSAWLHSDPDLAVALMKTQHPASLSDMRQNNPSSPLTAEEADALAMALKRNPFSDSSKQDAMAGSLFQNMSGNEQVVLPRFFPLLSETAQLKRIPADVASWAVHDPSAARAWLATLPPGSVRATGQAALDAKEK